LEDAGVLLTDLTDSNPTHFGLGEPAALEAVARSTLRAGCYEPDPRGVPAAREALAERFGGSAADYWLTASTSEAYSWILAVLTDVGDSVAIPAPGYPLIEPLAALADVRTLAYPSHYLEPYGWYADTDAIAAAAGVCAFVVVNPGNPTGAYADGPTIEAVVAACDRGDGALVIDGVFEPFAIEGKARSLAGEDRVVTFALGGLSKLLCAPQLKLGWMRLSGPEAALGPLRAALDKIADTYLSVNAPVAMALPELLELSDGVVQRTRERLAVNVAAARRILGEAPYRVRRCEGGWTAIVDVPRYADVDDLVLRLMREAGLSVHPGWYYDLASAGALALSLLPEPADFEDRCRRLRAAVDAFAL
jgi:aspartate/methionine/tyrosine aminotransferase